MFQASHSPVLRLPLRPLQSAHCRALPARTLRPAQRWLATKPPAVENVEKVTKAHLLAQATSRWGRAWVHVRWPLTRNNRLFGVDDLSAVASWFVMGNLLWIVLGTTTFGLVAMYSVDKLDRAWKSVSGEEAEETRKDDGFLGYLAGAVLSHGLGVHFVFERGNVVPELSDGMLKFKNVRVYLSTAADTDQVAFSAKIAQLNLDLSFKKWYEGNGLVNSMDIYGIHAKVYRNHASAAHDDVLASGVASPLSSMALSFTKSNDANNVHSDTSDYNYEELVRAGADRAMRMDADYLLSQVRIHDSVVELYENNDAKPFRITIFNCDLPRVRGNRLLIDFFNANNVTGAVNNSMFTIHKHQTFSDSDNTVRFKLDGVDMGSLLVANAQLKFNWIVSGKAQITADIRMPTTVGLDKIHNPAGVFQRLFDGLRALTNPTEPTESEPRPETGLLKGAFAAIYEKFTKQDAQPSDDNDYVIVNAKVKFKDLKATLPLHLPMASSRSVPFITLQNLRQLIAYINSIEDGQPLVINTTVIEKMSDLYDLDNISQTRVFDAIVSDIYDDLLRLIKLDEKRIIEEKSSMWSHSVVSQLLLLGLGVLA